MRCTFAEGGWGRGLGDGVRGLGEGWRWGRGLGERWMGRGLGDGLGWVGRGVGLG